MTDKQFETLMEVLNEINANIKLITTKDTNNQTYGLSDLFTQLQSVKSAVESVESAVKRKS